jgi:GntR family transcriptional regulator
LEIRGVLDTQQGTGTFVSDRTQVEDEAERARRLEQFVNEVVSRAGAAGFTLRDVAELLQQRLDDTEPKKRTK